jgi:Rhodopirellula transposase DDE domain
LHEMRTQIRCQERFGDRGRQRTEEQDPSLVEAIHRLAQPHSQVDAQFKSPFLYTRLTAAKLRQALVEQEGYASESLPTVRTFSTILNRLHYRLRPVQKSRPAKKVKETDAIFANVQEANQAADASPECLRISLDCKATVSVGDYSRQGQARGPKAVAALDHDLATKKNSCPAGF